MKKHIWITFAVIAVSIVIAVAFSANATLNATPQIANPSFDLPTSIIQVDSRYLSSPPNFPNNSYKVTEIFLESATVWQDSSDGSLAGDLDFPVPEGMPFFVVNGTIRNDYLPTEIIALSKEGVSKCTIGLDIYFYDAQGNFVNTLHRGNPFRGCYEVSLRSGERANFEAPFVTHNENVAYIEVYVSFLDPLPLF